MPIHSTTPIKGANTTISRRFRSMMFMSSSLTSSPKITRR